MSKTRQVFIHAADTVSEKQEAVLLCPWLLTVQWQLKKIYIEHYKHSPYYPSNTFCPQASKYQLQVLPSMLVSLTIATVLQGIHSFTTFSEQLPFFLESFNNTGPDAEPFSSRWNLRSTAWSRTPAFVNHCRVGLEEILMMIMLWSCSCKARSDIRCCSYSLPLLQVSKDSPYACILSHILWNKALSDVEGDYEMNHGDLLQISLDKCICWWKRREEREKQRI